MSKEIFNIDFKDKIAQGAFGNILMGVDKVTGEEVAIKIEKKGTVIQLEHEYNIYRKIASPGVPKVYDFGRVEYDSAFCNSMSMELLGLSLEKHFLNLNKIFSVKTVFMIAKSCISRIEYLHHKHYIHRDIKPDNFVTDRAGKKIYLIDFGLAKEYRNPNTLIHRPIKIGKNLTGTARYASLNTHLGHEQSRRDDLEGLGFSLIYFLKNGQLPWQNLKASSKNEKYVKIKEKKEEISLFKLCEGLPNEMYLYMIHVRNLKYEENPDYSYLESLFEDGLKVRGYEDDSMFDWRLKFEK